MEEIKQQKKRGKAPHEAQKKKTRSNARVREIKIYPYPVYTFISFLVVSIQAQLSLANKDLFIDMKRNWF